MDKFRAVLQKKLVKNSIKEMILSKFKDFLYKKLVKNSLK